MWTRLRSEGRGRVLRGWVRFGVNLSEKLERRAVEVEDLLELGRWIAADPRVLMKVARFVASGSRS